MTVHVTGFSQFGKVTQNPTEDIARAINEGRCKAPSPHSEAASVAQEALILEVSESGVAEGLRRLWQRAGHSIELSVGAGRCLSFNDIPRAKEEAACGGHAAPILHLHLGVNTMAKCFNLEKFAYNEKTFSMADVASAQPQHEPIVNEDPVGLSRATTVNIEKLCETLRDMQYPVEVSHDPGRYLCNMCYYLSLAGCARLQNGHALFVHVPPAETISIDKQLAFVMELIRLWQTGSYVQVQHHAHDA